MLNGTPASKKLVSVSSVKESDKGLGYVGDLFILKLAAYRQKHYICNHKRRHIMLGINSERRPVSEEAAKDIRESAQRIATGKLSSEDHARVERSRKALSHYNFRWIGLDGRVLG